MNIYDFDKTIYRHDCTMQFYLFILKKYPKLWWHIFKTGFFGLGKVLHIISLSKFKEKFFSYLKYIPDVEKDVKEFWDKEIININDWYFEKREKDDIVCSASPHFLLDEIIPRLNVSATLVCSNMDLKTGKYAEGEISCSGKEKVRRLEELGYKGFLEGYSDSVKDVPMLKMCKKRYRIKKGKITVFNEKYFK